ncbi:hypothetical protein D3C85_1262580 [compost metagenome]
MQARLTPLGRLAHPEEVATMVLAAAGAMPVTTGVVISVDGGRPLCEAGHSYKNWRQDMRFVNRCALRAALAIGGLSLVMAAPGVRADTWRRQPVLLQEAWL